MTGDWLEMARRQEAADAAEREQALRERDEAESVETIEAEWSRAFACHDEPRVFYSNSHQEKFIRG